MYIYICIHIYVYIYIIALPLSPEASHMINLLAFCPYDRILSIVPNLSQVTLCFFPLQRLTTSVGRRNCILSQQTPTLNDDRPKQLASNLTIRSGGFLGWLGYPQSSSIQFFRIFPTKNSSSWGYSHDYWNRHIHLWVKSCHNPPMTGNGNHTTEKKTWWWLGNG